jgi:putative ABC transport system permease protein
MITGYLKAALRNLWMHRGFSFINIAGLSIGLGSSFIIMLYSIHELSYDSYNKNLADIYLVTAGSTQEQWLMPTIPFVVGPALKNECPEVQQYARFMRGRCPIKYKDKTFDREPCLSSDPSIFQILTLPLKSGSLQGLTSEQDFAVISNQVAQKIFGDAYPIGEVITVNWLGMPYNLKVAAVMKDIPQNSTMRAEIIVPLNIAEKWFPRLAGNQGGNILESWTTTVFPTLVLLSHPGSKDQLEKMMASFTQRHIGPGRQIQFHLFPVKDLYYHPPAFSMNLFPTGNISNVYIYSTIAILILLVACFNFVILSTGRASVRTKEVALRKVVGASRFDLMKQIMLESVLVSILSLPFAMLIVELALPSVSLQLGKRLLDLSSFNLNYLILFAGITLLAGILSGSYVSFYLSGFRPMEILRSKISTGASKATLRKIMIGIQMIIFIGLVTGSLAMYRQVLYFHSKDMGFAKQDLIVFSRFSLRLGSTSDPSRFDLSKFEAFKSELATNPSIESVSGAETLPGREEASVSKIPVKSDPSRAVSCQTLSVDRDFIETMKMQMVSGKSFARTTPEESRHAVIINESAVRAFGFSDLSNETIQDQRILGVVKDFNFSSLHNPIAPVVIRCDTSVRNEIAVRVRHDADVEKTLSFILAKSMTFNSGKPMDYQFFDDRLDDLYGDDYRFARMIGLFTALAIFITCLGLFGVSLFVVQTRVKEIGIRKILGASVGTILYLVAREFFVLILISTIVATPIAIYFVNGWLQNFAYRVPVDPFLVLFTLLVAVAVVTVAIGYQALKAAIANPVEALRYE